jgi:hypothetical protein
MPSESSGLVPTASTRTNSTPGPVQSDTGHNHEQDTLNLPTGGIAGVAIGSAVVLLLAGSLVYVCGRQGGFEKGYRRRTTTNIHDPAKDDSPIVQTNPPSSDLAYSSPASPSQWSPFPPVASSPRRSHFQPYSPGVTISSPVLSVSSQGLFLYVLFYRFCVGARWAFTD